MLLAMDKSLPERVRRWLDAGLLDPDQAARILAYEAQVPAGRQALAALAIALGAALVGAGILLFVAAHWAHLGPAARFTLVLALVGGLHLGAASAARWPVPATALHGLGTLALGAGVFLAGQIFNLQEHWPAGLLLWALGAWAGYALLRDWVQGALAALLTPAWLMGEWVGAVSEHSLGSGADQVMALGCLLLAGSYLSARLPGRDSPLRRALAWIGGLTVLPCALWVLVSHGQAWETQRMAAHGSLYLAGWTAALGLPLGLALALRGRAAWMNAAATAWALALARSAAWGPHRTPGWVPYGVCALGALGLILWGLAEARRERVSLGLAGFFLTLLAFYFSSVMDKLGRSLGLMGLGLLFVAGGWQLERLRRQLIARIGPVGR
jgi:uncharacterized membrane protein